MKHVENRVLGIAAIVYAVGVAGFYLESTRSLFITLTPWNIAGAVGLSLLFHKQWSGGLFAALLCIATAGFFVEYAGVHTGLIFGSYQYGKTLGAGWQGIPFLIGLNWAGLVYGVTSLLSFKVKNPWLAAITGAALMTGYDFLLEPAAIKFDMWTWTGNSIPLKNYIAWFLTSLVFIRLFLYMTKAERNKVAAGLFLIQMAFFGLLMLLM